MSQGALWLRKNIPVYFINANVEKYFIDIKQALQTKFFFFRFYLFIFRERMGGRKRKKHQCVVASCAPPTGDLPHNPGM